MPQDQVLLTILGAVVLMNVLILAVIPLQARGRRPSLAPVGRSSGGDQRDDADARTAAAIEAYVSGISADSAGRARPPAPSEAISGRLVAVMGAAPETTAIQTWATWTDRPQADPREPSTSPPPALRVKAPDWTTTGLADAATWDRAVREASARVASFGRPVTVVMAELPHLDDVVRRLGRDIADRVVTETARLLVSESRAVDRIAWLGDARFGVLLVETDEIHACGYVGRVRAATDRWLETAGLSIRLSLGWAGAAEGGDVMAAAAIAQELMHDGAHRASVGSR